MMTWIAARLKKIRIKHEKQLTCACYFTIVWKICRLHNMQLDTDSLKYEVEKLIILLLFSLGSHT